MKHHVFILAVATLIATGCNTVPPVKLHIHQQVPEALPPSHVRQVTIPQLDLKLAIDPFPALTDAHVGSADLYPTALGMGIMLHFDPHGLNLLNQVTTECRGRYLVFFLDDRPVSAWLVDRPILNGQLLLEGPVDPQEAQRVVDSINREGKKRARLLW